MALTAQRLIRVKGVAPGVAGQPMEDLPLLAAIPDIAPSTLPANGVIGGLAFSDPPTQAECQALRDECENLRDALNSIVGSFNDFKTQFEVSTGVPIFEDS